MFKELDYQEKAVKELLSKADQLLDRERPATCKFKAPTGSGKTIMMAKFLHRLVIDQENKRALSFIWAAPRKLHNQSKEKLEKYYESNRTLECLNIDDLIDKQIQDNEILFLNWESIIKTDNVFVQENEQDFNLSSIIANTREAGREIVLIIDESHHTASTENTKGLIEIMNPKLTIEVSATPHLDSDHIISVDFEEVRKEGMIKNQVSVNPELPPGKLEAKSGDEFILENALRKRVELRALFVKMGKNINPLLMIQLPDKSNMDFSDKQAEIESVLSKRFKINRENGKLAVYLSEDKHNLENISKNDNEAEVMIFKQAIALGWDCPRAYILVLFREWHSETFSIQTVGRIMRMPEAKHYEIDSLDKAYLYTNIANNKIIIDEDIAKGYYTLYTSDRIKAYEKLRLRSCHSKRQRETTRLRPAFINIFLEQCKKMGTKKSMDLKVTGITDHIPIDGVIHPEKFGTDEKVVEMTKNLSLAKTLKELEDAFKWFMADRIKDGGMYPEERSVGRVCSGIYEFFLSECSMNYQQKQREIMTIVLSPKNQQCFKDVLNASLHNYQDIHQKKDYELVQDSDWEVPEKREYGAQYKEWTPKVKRSVLDPFYRSRSEDRQWKTETDFIKFIDEDKNRDGTFFAVPYKDEKGADKPFYVDFIVKLKNGKMGLFDTKSGITAKIAGPKSDGLQAYIKEENLKHKNLFGGIVVPKSGSFWIYSKPKYQYDEDLTGWEILRF